MRCFEVFSIALDPDSANADVILDAYWEIELMIAGEHGLPYSDLLRTDIEDRTCSICGSLAGTDESGSIMNCSHVGCVSIRDYFGIFMLVHIKLANRNDKKSRKQFLQSRVKKDFGSQVLRAIPKELRFDYLLKAKYDRENFESQAIV